MRIKISASSRHRVFFPYNYHYALHAALYKLIQQSSEKYSEFLHDKGYVRDGINKLFKLFTFSKLNFFPKDRDIEGFHGVTTIQFTFSTIMEKSMRHLILGAFLNKNMMLNLDGQNHIFEITHVDVMDQVEFSERQSFVCLSPITISTIKLNESKKKCQHFLDYMIEAEKDYFVNNLKKNLIHKYETINNTFYENDHIPFIFSFDDSYIKRKNGKISKLIQFKNSINIKAMEAPFSIMADPELIRIGYECGWGEKNSAGFGCVEWIADC